MFNICVIIYVFVLLLLNRSNFIETILNESTVNTRFSPTYFEIYDKSTSNVCDRLIIIYPFIWYLLAAEGEVYIVGDTNFSCNSNNVDAIKVPKTDTGEFIYCCLNFTLDELLHMYTNIPPTKILFNIKELQEVPNKFTVIDALNFLFTKYITMTNNVPSLRMQSLLTHIVELHPHMNAKLEQLNRTHTTKKLTKRDIHRENDRKSIGYISPEVEERIFRLVNKWIIPNASQINYSNLITNELYYKKATYAVPVNYNYTISTSTSTSTSTSAPDVDKNTTMYSTDDE